MKKIYDIVLKSTSEVLSAEWNEDHFVHPATGARIEREDADILEDFLVTFQYRENYGTDEQPHWKNKGTVDYIVKATDSEAMYQSEQIIEAIMKRWNDGNSGSHILDPSSLMPFNAKNAVWNGKELV